jgi:hypothetical protein
MEIASDPPDWLRTKDEVFAALPPLGSQEYLQHVRHAPKSELPASVLARAFHVLSQDGPDQAAQDTLSRLFREKDGKPEYMGWLLYEAQKLLPPGQIGYDAFDLYMETLEQIARALARPSGARAYIGWKSFCYHRLIDARRAHFGKKGQRIEPVHIDPSTTDQRTGATVDLLEHPVGVPDWHGSVLPDQEEALWAFVQQRVEEIQNAQVREVTLALHFGPNPVRASGKNSAGKPPALTDQLGLSIDQINRAKASGEAIIRAAVEEWRNRAESTTTRAQAVTRALTITKD